MVFCIPCLGIKKLKLDFDFFVWRLGRASGGAFYSNASTCNYFIIKLRSLDTHVPFGFFFYLPPSPPLATNRVKFGFRACRKVCTCGEGPCPPSLNFHFFKNHFNFASFPPFSFTFPLPPFFDGLFNRMET
jgi:hypothetical protein